MKKYKRIKKKFHFTARSNSYKVITFCSKWNKGFETEKGCIVISSLEKIVKFTRC